MSGKAKDKQAMRDRKKARKAASKERQNAEKD